MFYIFHCEWLVNASRKHFFSTTSCFIYFFCGVEKFFCSFRLFYNFLVRSFSHFLFCKGCDSTKYLKGKGDQPKHDLHVNFQKSLEKLHVGKQQLFFRAIFKGDNGYLAWFVFRCFDDFFFFVLVWLFSIVSCWRYALQLEWRHFHILVIRSHVAHQ